MNQRVIDTRPIDRAVKARRRAKALHLEDGGEARFWRRPQPAAINEGELQPELPMPEPVVSPVYKEIVVQARVPAIYEHAPMAGLLYRAVTRPVKKFVYFFFLDRRDY